MPGMMPSAISGWPRRAVLAATRKSAHSASSRPPPSAKPVIAAIVGFGIFAIAVIDDLHRVDFVDDVEHRHVGHLFDVRAGGEDAFAAVDHRGADRRVE